MKRSVLVVALACAIGFPALASAASKVAPADEYFGRMKMSVLEISNHIRDTDARVGFDPEHASRYYGMLALTQDAFEDWARKYPRDSWIPERAYKLSHLFWKMHRADADRMAGRDRSLLFRLFPRSRFAVIARTESAAKVAPAVPAAQADAGPGSDVVSK